MPLTHTGPLSSVKPLAKRCLSMFVGQCASANWVQQLSSVLCSSSNKAVEGDYVHPCIVATQQTLIHARDLAYRNPEFYAQLQRYADVEGYVLLADRRQEDSSVASERRSGILPVLFLSLGLSSAVTAQDHSVASVASVAELHSTLSLFDSNAVHNEMGNIDVRSSLPSNSDIPKLEFSDTKDSLQAATENTATTQIAEILRQHYKPSASTPDYIDGDLQAMAEYFSRYPQALDLLVSLKGYNWQLVYSKDTFETQVRGSQIQVRSVKVNFDSRAAAQLNSHRACLQQEKRGACVASPADALLHELLHARSALLESEQFIAQGGMNSVLYPYEHETAVIQSENLLYQAMSSVDGAYRPNRHAHQGRVVASACVTCLQ